MTRALAIALLATGPIAAAPASAAAPALYKNCTALNKMYPHGVGRVDRVLGREGQPYANATDKTSSTPVTTFKRSNSLYRTAMSFNKGLDRDKDGIACEQN